MLPDGNKVDKMNTYHNFGGGWYLQLEGDWASRIFVSQREGTYIFYLWDDEFINIEKLMTIYAFTGQNREEQAVSEDRFLLYRSDSVVYAAELEISAANYEVAREKLTKSFHLIHQDWKTGET